MEHHTVILETSNKEIPKGQIVPFVLDLISKDQFLVDYFGCELDHQADYIDEEMQHKIDTKTVITINFETEEPIDYDSLTSFEASALISHNLKHPSDIEIIVEDNDITIHLSKA